MRMRMLMMVEMELLPMSFDRHVSQGKARNDGGIVTCSASFPTNPFRIILNWPIAGTTNTSFDV